MRVEDQFLYPLFFAFSPYTYSSDYACSVTSFGAVVDLEGYDDVYDSYGSPNTRYGNSAIDVGINGGVGNSYYAVVDDSYGSPDTLNSSHAWDVTSSGFVGDDYNYGIIYSSYGK